MNPKDLSPTRRFSDRVVDYERYRPSYPASLLDFLSSRIGGLQGSRVADVGAGTGIFSKLLLDRGALVDLIEPNADMLSSAVRNLGQRAGARFRNGTAEATGLPSASVGLITCAQAFHWFDPVKARGEFDRILKAGGWVALIWNDPRRDTEFGKAYEELKSRFGEKEFESVKQVTQGLDSIIPSFFGSAGCDEKEFDFFQDLERDGLMGRYFSSSYAPGPQSPLRSQAMESLSSLFDRFQKEGVVRLEYRTELFLGG